MLLPAPIQNLIDALSRLPGVGPKTASRLTFYLLRAPDEQSLILLEALQMLKAGTGFCPICFNITEADRTSCEICANPDRDGSILCVVEEPLDVLALERTGGYREIGLNSIQESAILRLQFTHDPDCPCTREIWRFRLRGPSNSQKKTPCQVPRTSRPFSTATNSEAPTRVDLI